MEKNVEVGIYWDNSGTLMYEEYYITDNLVGKKVF